MIKTLPSSPLAPSAAANTLQSDANGSAHAEATAEEAAAFMGALASVLSTLGPEAPKQGTGDGASFASGASSLVTPNTQQATSLTGKAEANAGSEVAKNGFSVGHEPSAEHQLSAENGGEGAQNAKVLSASATRGTRLVPPPDAQVQTLLSTNVAATQSPTASPAVGSPDLANVLQREGPGATSIDLGNANPSTGTLPPQPPSQSATEVPQSPTVAQGNLRASDAFGPVVRTESAESAPALQGTSAQSSESPQGATQAPPSPMILPREDGLGNGGARGVRNDSARNDSARNDAAQGADVTVAKEGVGRIALAESGLAQATPNDLSRITDHTADARTASPRFTGQEHSADSAPTDLDDSTHLFETEDASREKSIAPHDLSSNDVALEKASPTNDAPRIVALEGRDSGATDLPAQEGAVTEGTPTEHSVQDKVASESATQANRESRDQQLLRRMQQAFPTADVRIRTDAQGLTQVSLDHPSLGAVDLQLQFSGAGMDVAARVQSGVAAALLRRSEDSLRRRVGRQGIALRSMRISGNARRSPNNHPTANTGRSRAIDLEA